MTEDEIGMFKQKMYDLVMQRMLNCNIWGNTLSGNCLPACLCILPDIQMLYPDASVKIGDIGRAGDNPPDSLKFHQFLKCQRSDPSSFHAWIDLGTNDLFDPVGASWLGLSDTYLDASKAQVKGVSYHPVLTKSTEVKSFYDRLLSLRPTI